MSKSGFTSRLKDESIYRKVQRYNAVSDNLYSSEIVHFAVDKSASETGASAGVLPNP